MNILFIKHIFVGFVVSEIHRVSVFGNCPYSVTFESGGSPIYMYLFKSDMKYIGP